MRAVKNNIGIIISIIAMIGAVITANQWLEKSDEAKELRKQLKLETMAKLDLENRLRIIKSERIADSVRLYREIKLITQRNLTLEKEKSKVNYLYVQKDRGIDSADVAELKGLQSTLGQFRPGKN